MVTTTRCRPRQEQCRPQLGAGGNAAAAGGRWKQPRRAASALSGAEPVETLLLLVAERTIKLFERGLHGLHRAQHRVEPLLHRLQTADRRERPISGAIRV